MADISQEIDDFKNAIYGEEVRDSMVSLAQKLNTEVEGNTTNVNQAVETANSASSAANQAVQNANTTLQAANQAVQNAAGSASAAAGSASAAAGSAENAAESATAASGSASAAAQSAADAAEVAEGLGGFTGAASSVTAQDVEGLLGTPGAQSNVQALIDAIANQVLNQLVKKSQIINNLLATQAGNVLDATQGKALKDLIDQVNSDMQNRGTVLAANGTVANSPNNYFDVCSLELPDAPYLVLGRLNALFNGTASDLMFAQLGDTIVRTTLQSGGGCVVWAYSDGGETLSLRSYGYTTNSGNFSGALLAIRLK